MHRRGSRFALVLPLLTASCALSYAAPGELAHVAPLPVSGRQGVLLHQRISFGSYATSEVSRSATRGTEVSDALQSHGGDYRQRYAFSLSRAGSKVADVDCTAEGSGAETLTVTWRMKRVLTCSLQTVDGTLHSLQLESSRDQPLSGRLAGSAALEVTGSNRVGRGRLDGTAGYDITQGSGTPVAAVDITNRGAVYLARADDDVAAALAAALLLYQDPLQNTRFGDG
jgi:hypothetical protein